MEFASDKQPQMTQNMGFEHQMVPRLSKIALG